MKLLCTMLICLFMSTVLSGDEAIEDSIVKIFTVSKIPSYSTPWNSSVKRSHASGAIIPGNRILTNAHVVANQTFIEVKRYGDTKRYEAKVEYISHQADLALLRVEDAAFFKGVTSLELDGLPNIQQKITVYGFPTGGNSLSVSTGVVSRIEHNRYVHSKEIFLAIQIDAAINPGSSGGPAISDGKIVGVVMQQIPKSQNIGYLVPVEVIKHFLDDVNDKKYDGFPHLGITTEMMENRALRSVHQMKKEQSGVLVIDMSERSPAFGALQKGDVLLQIDGHKIENDGTVEFQHHQYTSFKYYIDQKQIGETLVLTLLRDGKVEHASVILNNIADDHLLVNTVVYDTEPKYLIYGGYVFTPLTRNLLTESRATLLPLRELANQWATEEKEEVVILLKVLASETNRGDHNFSLWTVDKLNGRSYKNFNDFLDILKNAEGEYLLLEDKEGVQIAINREDAEAIEATILERYSIKSSERR